MIRPWILVLLLIGLSTQAYPLTLSQYLARHVAYDPEVRHVYPQYLFRKNDLSAHHSAWTYRTQWRTSSETRAVVLEHQLEGPWHTQVRWSHGLSSSIEPQWEWSQTLDKTGGFRPSESQQQRQYEKAYHDLQWEHQLSEWFERWTEEFRNLYLEQRREQLHREAFHQAQEHFKQHRVLYDHGFIALHDYQEAQWCVAEQQWQWEKHHQHIQQHQNEISQRLNLTHLSLDTEPFPHFKIPSVEEALTHAQQHHTDFKFLKLKLSRARQQCEDLNIKRWGQGRWGFKQDHSKTKPFIEWEWSWSGEDDVPLHNAQQEIRQLEWEYSELLRQWSERLNTLIAEWKHEQHHHRLTQEALRLQKRRNAMLELQFQHGAIEWKRLKEAYRNTLEQAIQCEEIRINQLNRWMRVRSLMGLTLSDLKPLIPSAWMASS